MKRLSRNWAEYNESLAQTPDVRVAETEWLAPLKSFLTGRPASVLEIGCSNGRYLVDLGKTIEAKELVGVDIISCRTPESMGFVQADARRLPFRDGAFDLAYSMGVLEHFDEGDRATLIKEQSRVLRPGGLIMIVMPNCTLGSVRSVKTKFLDMFRDYHHVIFSPSQIREELRRQHFEVLLERFMGSSLHMGNVDISRLHLLPGSRLLSDEYVILGRRTGDA